MRGKEEHLQRKYYTSRIMFDKTFKMCKNIQILIFYFLSRGVEEGGMRKIIKSKKKKNKHLEIYLSILKFAARLLQRKI